MKRNDIIFWLIVMGLLLVALGVLAVAAVGARPCGETCAFVTKPTAMVTSAPVYVAPPATQEPAAYPAPATATQESGYPAPEPDDEPTAIPTPDATMMAAPTATPPDPSKDYVPPTATAPRAYP